MRSFIHSDLNLLPELSVSSVSSSLQERWLKDEVYTYVGEILVSVNPFKSLKIYSDKTLALYSDRYHFEVPPHVFAVAQKAYSDMMMFYEHQCIVFDGVSGSGKTEALKLCLRFLCHMADPVSAPPDHVKRVKRTLLQGMHVVEAFGCCSTLTNSNSSRYGQYVDVKFNLAGDIIGGQIAALLLNSSRVTRPSLGHNFHVFYHALRGMNGPSRAMFHLEKKSANDFAFLSTAGASRDPSDSDDHSSLLDGLRAVGLSEAQIRDVFRIVAAVLWLGELQFVEAANGGARLQEGARDALQHVSALCGVTPRELEVALLTQRVGIPLEASGGGALSVETMLANSQIVGVTVPDAYRARDTLAESLYARLFAWIVRWINEALSPEAVFDKQTDIQTVDVGLLDLFGFDQSTTKASYSDLIHNTAADFVHQQLVRRVFVQEQEEYIREGIDWVPVNFYDNQVTLDLVIDGDASLLALLAQSATDAEFVSALNARFDSHPAFAASSGSVGADVSELAFVVRHFAGDVEYSAKGFAEAAQLPDVWDQLGLVFENSDIALMRQLFPAGSSNAALLARAATRTSHAQRAFSDLASSLSQTTPHWVLCVKPLHGSSRDMSVSVAARSSWDDAFVRRQIQSLAIEEAIRVRRGGFSFRMAYDRFLARYKPLSNRTWPNWKGPAPAGCELLLRLTGVEPVREYVCGKTMIMIRQPASLLTLETQRLRKMQSLAVLVQRAWRRHADIMFRRRMQLRALTDLLDRKARRRISVTRTFLGDYIGAREDPSILAELDKVDETRILFAAPVLKVNKRLKDQERQMIVTQRNMWNFDKGALRRRIAIAEIAKISLSPFPDHFVVVHVPKEYDYVFIAENKAELVATLMEQHERVVGAPLELCISATVSYCQKKRGDSHSIEFSLTANSSGMTYSRDPKRKRVMVVSVGVQPDELAPDDLVARVIPHYQKLADPRYVLDSATSPPASQNTEPLRPPPPPGLVAQPQQASPPSPPPVAAAPPDHSAGTWATALHPYSAQSDTEIGFEKGARILVLSQDSDGWWASSFQGKTGYIPGAYVKLDTS